MAKLFHLPDTPDYWALVVSLMSPVESDSVVRSVRRVRPDPDDLSCAIEVVAEFGEWNGRALLADAIGPVQDLPTTSEEDS